MPFPIVERVIYEKNPLDEVICQLRFPPILKIDTEAPAELQERIRDQFPFYVAKPVGSLPKGLPSEIAKLISMNLAGAGTAHEFESRDREWKISLTKDFIALSTKRYVRWEEFTGQLREPLRAFEGIYRPVLYTRIGLRYRDVIKKSILGLESVPWSELIQPWIGGPIGHPEIVDVQEFGSAFLVQLPKGSSKARVRHGLAIDDESQENCYLIDADFFDESQTELNDVTAKLDSLNRESRYLFRWCITDKLHEAMEPRRVTS